MAASYRRSASASPKNSRPPSSSTPKRKAGGAAVSDQSYLPAFGCSSGSTASPGAAPEIRPATRHASATVNAKIDTQSSERHAGTTPVVLKRPLLGLRPTTLLNDAGTR